MKQFLWCAQESTNSNMNGNGSAAAPSSCAESGGGARGKLGYTYQLGHPCLIVTCIAHVGVMLELKCETVFVAYLINY